MPQAKTKAKDRAGNVDGVYSLLNTAAIKDKSILVVDDVMTTGATLEAVAKELRKGKPKSLHMLTFASAKNPE